MNILSFDNEHNIVVEPEALRLAPFKVLHKRDKTRSKTRFLDEMAFIYFFCNPKSDYLYITNEADRTQEIAINLGFKKRGDADSFKIDIKLREAITFYKSFRTVTEELYFGATIAADAVNRRLKDADALLDERDFKSGKPIYTIREITSAITQIPKIMRDLKTAYKEVVEEKKETDGRSKGSKDFNAFEDGL